MPLARPGRRPAPFLSSAAVAAAALAAALADGAAAADVAEPSPIEVFRRYARDRDPVLRRKAVAGLAEVRGGEVVEALLSAARDEDGAVRDKAESILLAGRDRSDEIAALAAALGAKAPAETRVLAARALSRCGLGASAALRGLLSHRDAGLRRLAVRGLGAIRDGDAARDLHAALADPDALVRAAVLDVLADLLGADAVGAAVATALDENAVEPRVAALTVIGRFAAAAGADAAIRCLGDDAWSTRTAAARALGALRDDAASARTAAAALVRAMAREPRARVRVEIAEALWAITGIDFGADPARWTRWFEETGGRFDPPAKRPARARQDAGATRGGLADLPLESEHVAFVFDASHSMSDPVRFGAKRTKRDDLVDAFEAVLERLPKGSWINLVAFSTGAQAMRPALFEATPAARQATLRHLAKTVPDGRTNIYDAVELALRDPGADTLVLLTDGAPSAGARTQRGAILEGVRDMNRYRLARIHTVEIGSASTAARWKGFLAELSRDSGGHHLAR